ncbi:hypothetical protein FB451DRAFT_1190925 [Mycena latifolia]|nr:hypothetical protein FB451DRAFT_1190925 [Mycena latifolia]
MAGGALPAFLLVVWCCPLRVGIRPRGIGKASVFLSYGSSGGRRGEEEGCATHCWRPYLRGRTVMARLGGMMRCFVLWVHVADKPSSGFASTVLCALPPLRSYDERVVLGAPVSLPPARPSLARFGPRRGWWVGRPSSFTALPSSLVGLWMRAWRCEPGAALRYVLGHSSPGKRRGKGRVEERKRKTMAGGKRRPVEEDEGDGARARAVSDTPSRESAGQGWRYPSPEHVGLHVGKSGPPLCGTLDTRQARSGGVRAAEICGALGADTVKVTSRCVRRPALRPARLDGGAAMPGWGALDDSKLARVGARVLSAAALRRAYFWRAASDTQNLSLSFVN